MGAPLSPLNCASRRSRTDTPEDSEPSRAGCFLKYVKEPERVGVLPPQPQYKDTTIFLIYKILSHFFCIILHFFAPTRNRTQHHTFIKNS